MVLIKDLLIQRFPWTATPQQDSVFELLSQFLSSFHTQDCFVLKGYAGTGKTTIISSLVKTLPI
ncbi:hypothetical protein OKW96_19645 [Sphingobacterium sp. KU25419]|nr:hypothetical protein OKW96_19645 [Sphingobacterium sp. KU25419]